MNTLLSRIKRTVAIFCLISFAAVSLSACTNTGSTEMSNWWYNQEYDVAQSQ